MATPLPARLKGELGRFAVRAQQLEKYRPIATYWCEYYILQHILNRQLHTADEECQTYAIALMDKLEAAKTANAANDAMVDDVAAKAYMEEFALSTFRRGDEAQRTNHVTRQTADTFQAAATFLDLLTIWGAPEAEVAAKSKFAKFHALRIAKAIKAGEDPNATNPVVEEPKQLQPAVEMADEDGVEQELQDLEGAGGATAAAYQPPSVESAPESGMPSRAPSAAPDGRTSAVSPLDHHPAADANNDDAAARQNSIGGGYFPSVPSAPTTTDTAIDTAMPDHPEDPQETPGFGGHDIAHEAPPASMQAAAAAQPTPASPGDFYTGGAPQAPAAATGASLPTPPGAPDRPSRPPPDQMDAQPPRSPPLQTSAAPAPAPAAAPAAFAPRAVAPAGAGGPAPTGSDGPYRTDDDSVAQAQKHAKWAISALNFEDVGTAVRELRGALESLGAR